MGSLGLLSEPGGICVRNEFLGEALLSLLCSQHPLRVPSVLAGPLRGMWQCFNVTQVALRVAFERCNSCVRDK